MNIKQIAQVMMTPEERVIVQQKLREVASILYRNTPSQELETFETVELSVREHLLETVAPKIGEFFLAQQEEQMQEEGDK
jgi:Trp operon repressor